jgi:hypothetical protein
MSAPTDILKLIEDERIVRERDARKIMNTQKEMKNEIHNFVEHTNLMIQEISNPHPMLITVCILATLLVIYLIYWMCFRPNLDGHWYDKDCSHWHIHHNMMSDNITIITDYDNKDKENNNSLIMKGCVEKNKISVNEGKLIGIWNGVDTILFENGITIKRSCN